MDDKLRNRVSTLAAHYPYFEEFLVDIERNYDNQEWRDALTASRRALEAIESGILRREFDEEPRPGKGDHLSKVTQKLPRPLQAAARYVRDMGNIGAHWSEKGEPLGVDEVERTLASTCDLVEWYCDRYVNPRPAGSGRAPSGAEAAPVPRARARTPPEQSARSLSGQPSAPEPQPAAPSPVPPAAIAPPPARKRSRVGWSITALLIFGFTGIIVLRNPRLFPPGKSAAEERGQDLRHPPGPTASAPPKTLAPAPLAPADREWTRQPSGTSLDLHDMWGEGATLYAVGSGGTFLVTHDFGRRWQSLASDSRVDLYSVYGFAGGPVLAVGARGAVLCLDPARGAAAPCSATRPTDALLYSVWGRSADEIYAVGDKGVILLSKDRGRSFAQVHKGGSTLRRVAAGRDGEVWAVGWDGAVLRSPRWDAVPIGSSAWLYDLWSSAGADTLLVGADPTSKTGVLLQVPRAGKKATLLRSQVNPLYSIWGQKGGELRVAGVGAQVLHGTSAALAPEPIGPAAESGRPPTIKRLFGTAGGELYAVGLSGAIFHRQLAPGAESPALAEHGAGR